MSNQSPRANRSRRLLGPAALRACPLASPQSQARARLGPGGYCRCSGNGGPQTCLPAAHGVAVLAGLYGPSSSRRHSRPSRGAKRREADDARPPQEWPSQASSRGAEISRRGETSRGPHDVSHDAWRQAGASAQCPCFPFVAKEASAGAEYRGVKQRFPYRCNKTKTSRTEVTAEPTATSPPEPLASEDHL